VRDHKFQALYRVFISPLTVHAYGGEGHCGNCARMASKIKATPTNDIPLERKMDWPTNYMYQISVKV
jgi:hypothetical protein